MDKSQTEIESKLADLRIKEGEAWKTLQAFTNGDAWKSANSTRDNLTRIWWEIKSKVIALENATPMKKHLITLWFLFFALASCGVCVRFILKALI